MLRELRVRNFAVVDAVTVPFAPGLNVLTGETGAGKSILIDALLLVRGARAQTDVIRTDADTAIVEAVFSLDRRSAAVAVLEDAGLGPTDGDVLVRRELSRGGRHRAFVNDSLVTVALLERLGDELLEVHGQHEHQRLLEPVRQLALLDRFADAEDAVGRVGALFAAHREARESVERLRAAERDRAQREDLLRFQVSELDAARLKVGEDEELRLERRRLQHAERFAAGLAEVAALLDEDRESATARMARAERVLRDLARLDATFGEPAAGLETARVQLEEAMGAVRARRGTIVFDPARLAEIDDRLDALGRLKRKYGDTDEAMMRYRGEAAAELDRLTRHAEVLAADEGRAAALANDLDAAAAALSEVRRAAARRLGGQLERQLRALGMERARFDIVLEPLGAPMTARGADRVEFRLSVNPDEPPKALARIASGGELSRTMLALKAVLARADRVPILIFDEVDAGIGGRVAAAVAQALSTAAAGRQVLCVTHLAPIAAEAAHHVRVSKMVRGGRTRVTAAALAGDDRVTEIARMLGGDDAGRQTALGHARTMLRAAAR